MLMSIHTSRSARSKLKALTAVFGIFAASCGQATSESCERFDEIAYAANHVASRYNDLTLGAEYKTVKCYDAGSNDNKNRACVVSFYDTAKLSVHRFLIYFDRSECSDAKPDFFHDQKRKDRFDNWYDGKSDSTAIFPFFHYAFWINEGDVSPKPFWQVARLT
jgi:hypothetical protein